MVAGVEVTLECVYAADVDVARLGPQGSRLSCSLGGVSGTRRLLVGRLQQPDLFTRLVRDEAVRNTISRSHFELVCEGGPETLQLQRLTQNTVLLNGAATPQQQPVPLPSGSHIGCCSPGNPSPFLIFRASVQTGCAGGAPPASAAGVAGLPGGMPAVQAQQFAPPVRQQPQTLAPPQQQQPGKPQQPVTQPLAHPGLALPQTAVQASPAAPVAQLPQQAAQPPSSQQPITQPLAQLRLPQTAQAPQVYQADAAWQPQQQHQQQLEMQQMMQQAEQNMQLLEQMHHQKHQQQQQELQQQLQQANQQLLLLQQAHQQMQQQLQLQQQLQMQQQQLQMQQQQQPQPQQMQQQQQPQMQQQAQAGGEYTPPQWMDGDPMSPYKLIASLAEGRLLSMVPMECKSIPVRTEGPLTLGRQQQLGFFEGVLGADNRYLSFVSRSHIEVAPLPHAPGSFMVRNLSPNPIVVGQQQLNKTEHCSVTVPTSISFLAVVGDRAAPSQYLRLDFEPWVVGGAGSPPGHAAAGVAASPRSGRSASRGPPAAARDKSPAQSAMDALSSMTEKAASVAAALADSIQRVASPRGGPGGTAAGTRPISGNLGAARSGGRSPRYGPDGMPLEEPGGGVVVGSSAACGSASPAYHAGEEARQLHPSEVLFTLELGGTAVRQDFPPDFRRVCGGAGGLVIGRSHQQQLHCEALDDDVAQYISREHFRVERSSAGGSFCVVPMASNLMWLLRGSGRIAMRGNEPVQLCSGDVIQLFTGGSDKTPYGPNFRGTLYWMFVSMEGEGEGGPCAPPIDMHSLDHTVAASEVGGGGMGPRGSLTPRGSLAPPLGGASPRGSMAPRANLGGGGGTSPRGSQWDPGYQRPHSIHNDGGGGGAWQELNVTHRTGGAARPSLIGGGQPPWSAAEGWSAHAGDLLNVTQVQGPGAGGGASPHRGGFQPELLNVTQRQGDSGGSISPVGGGRGMLAEFSLGNEGLGRQHGGRSPRGGASPRGASPRSASPRGPSFPKPKKSSPHYYEQAIVG